MIKQHQRLPPLSGAAYLERQLHNRITHYDVRLEMGESGEYHATETNIAKAVIKAVQFNRQVSDRGHAIITGITDEGERVPISYE